MKHLLNLATCLLVSTLSLGQMNDYAYIREIKGISDQWHSLTLPDSLFEHVSENLAGVRIYGLTTSGDTVEAPYMLRLRQEHVSLTDVAFSTLNRAHNAQGQYITFEVPTSATINQIELQVTESNFDTQITLEGSQDQQEWFTIVENYRILSIKNTLTHFQFTTVSFSPSQYRYFRLRIPPSTPLTLTSASFAQEERTPGIFSTYSPKSTQRKEDKTAKQTELTVRLPLAVPVSHVTLSIGDNFDYYRPVTIEYLADSVKTEKGWKYRYQRLASGTLNSLQKTTFSGTTVITKELKIVIHNNDNQPLQVTGVEAKGYVYELVARFTEPATYFLAYGNDRAATPQYDIRNFSNRIPDNLPPLRLGAAQKVLLEQPSLMKPLFENKAWLWAITGVIIVVLGWFSLRMMKNA